MKEIMRISVKCFSDQKIETPDQCIVMIPFEASSDGPFFFGKTIMPGVDTQTYTKQTGGLSARYMMEGHDYTGAACRVFIENNGTDLEHCTPKVVTDSTSLAEWNTASLHAKGELAPDEILIHVYQE